MYFVIRPYQVSDERQVRRICFDTALYGNPIRDVFDDEAFIAEAWLSYYWRFEPQTFWVATEANRVAGYLTGCVDTSLFQRRYIWRVAPRLLTKFFRRR